MATTAAETADPRLKHVQVREYVRSLVHNLEPGDPAPSERELVQRFGVARMTVRHALDSLVTQGLLERIPGRGTFVAKPHVDMQAHVAALLRLGIVHPREPQPILQRTEVDARIDGEVRGLVLPGPNVCER